HSPQVRKTSARSRPGFSDSFPECRLISAAILYCTTRPQIPQVAKTSRSVSTISRRSPQGASDGRAGAGADGGASRSALQKRQRRAAARISALQAVHFFTRIDLQAGQTLASSGISSKQNGHVLMPGPPPVREYDR